MLSVFVSRLEYLYSAYPLQLHSTKPSRSLHLVLLIPRALVHHCGSYTVMKLHCSLVSRAAVLLSLILPFIANAQDPSPTTSYLTTSPTASWVPPNGVCSLGGSDPTGGTYVDFYGATYDVRCAARPVGTLCQSASQGTNGQGPYACFKGCDKRAGCVAFHYTGTSTGPKTGSGQCFYYRFI